MVALARVKVLPPITTMSPGVPPSVIWPDRVMSPPEVS